MLLSNIKYMNIKGQSMLADFIFFAANSRTIAGKTKLFNFLYII